MRLDLMRDRSKEFPRLDAPGEVREMRIWHCKYKSLRSVQHCTGLVELIIGSLPDDSLEFLRDLTRLRYLRILHLPKIHELSPLSSLTNLKVLSLGTSPSWDATGRIQEVSSLEPLSAMRLLKHLELFGVVPKDRSLKVLEDLEALETARLSGFPPEEQERIFRVTQLRNEFNPKSSFDGYSSGTE